MFKGSYTALITPFKNGDLDEQALRGLVNRQIESGTSGLVPCGTTGESPTLTDREQDQVIRIVMEEVKGRVPVMAGAGSNNTRHALELTQQAEQAGVQAVLHVAGYYNRPNQEGLYQHFKTISTL